jgi:cytochrome c-type biogenesis protein CcmH/NrfG
MRSAIIVVATLTTVVAGSVSLKSAPAPAVPAPASVINADIALFERRASEDPMSAADRAQLAMLYLQRGRETGEYEDFQRAERAARSALELRTDRNRKAMLGLASSLLAQHRFLDAKAAAAELVANDPTNAGSRALYAEILLELGDYSAADSQFTILSAHDDNLAVAPRLARWHELNGRDDEARGLLLRAARVASARTDLPAEQAAWFHLRVGDHALRNGRRWEARRAIRAGLSANPGDYRLIALRARLYGSIGHWRKALADVESIKPSADLATLALGGDAAARLGNALLAEEFYATVEKNAREKPEPFARQWTQFCLDHNRHLAEALATLEAEIRTRPDVLGHQLLARAYYLTNHAEKARTAMRQALRLGTKDRQLIADAREIFATGE